MTPRPIKRREQDVLEALTATLQAGYCPSVRELGDQLGLHWTGVGRSLKRLEELGYLKRHNPRTPSLQLLSQEKL